MLWSPWWVELLVLDPWLDKHSRALKDLDRDRYDDGFVMSKREVKPLFDGLRWMALGSPGWFFIDVFYEIQHSCLEYGTGVNV